MLFVNALHFRLFNTECSEMNVGFHCIYGECLMILSIIFVTLINAPALIMPSPIHAVPYHIELLSIKNPTRVKMQNAKLSQIA